MESSTKSRALVDLIAVTAWIASYIWWWRGSFVFDKAVLAIGLLGLSIYLHISRRESFLQVIAGPDSFRPALRWLAIWTTPPLLAVLIVVFIEKPTLPSWAEMGSRLMLLLLLGILQQYLLLAHIWRSTVDLVPGRIASMLIAAVIFSLLHLPNAFLVAATAVAGFAACWIYRRAPNIIAIGLAHGVLSWALYYGLPRTVTAGLRVGPNFS
jgi:membrane protease YdiL (CAAX protease family)